MYNIFIIRVTSNNQRKKQLKNTTKLDQLKIEMQDWIKNPPKERIYIYIERERERERESCHLLCGRKVQNKNSLT